MKVNVYDFDKTIYKNDSAVDFAKYTFKKHPFLIIWTLIKCIPFLVAFLFNKNLKKLKEHLMSYITKIDNLDSYVEEFWDEKQTLIKKWYLDQKQENDVVVSANFNFIIKPICKRLGIKYFISTDIDTKTGKIIGKQCRKDNKITMFREKYPKFSMNKTYSDSRNDIPLLEAGNIGYVVKGEKIEKYYKGYFK